MILGLYWALIVRPESDQAQGGQPRRLSKIDTPRLASAGVGDRRHAIELGAGARGAAQASNASFTAAIEILILEAGLKMTVGVFLSLSFASAAAGWAVAACWG